LQRRNFARFAYHIVNRWFDEFLLTAVVNANASRGTATPYRHMVQPWIISLFFDCENAGMLSWPVDGFPFGAIPRMLTPC
jgi:hypothetical protein